ncbi:hypothetical protein GCM10023347_24800 [Streptomyces chumphonensis]
MGAARIGEEGVAEEAEDDPGTGAAHGVVSSPSAPARWAGRNGPEGWRCRACDVSSLRVRALARRVRRRESPGSRIDTSPGLPAARAAVASGGGVLPGDSGGTAPDSHRLPPLPPFGNAKSTTAR